MKLNMLNWKISIGLMSLCFLAAPIAGAVDFSPCEKPLAPSSFSGGAGSPPVLPPGAGTSGASSGGEKFSINDFVKKNLRGDCLRAHPEAMANFKKSLITAWSFQASGWVLAEMGKDDSASKDRIRPPVDVLLNTALMIWLQQELGCKNTLAGIKKEDGGGFAFGDGLNRYKDFVKVTPLGMVTFGSLRMVEDVLLFAVDPEGRMNPWSTDQLKMMLSDAIFVGAFESMFLFPRWSWVQTPLELTKIPGWHKQWAAFIAPRIASLKFGNVKVFDPAWLSQMADFAAYRAGLNVFDNWIFFNARAISEDLFASIKLPEFEIDGELFYGFPTMDPSSIGTLILERIDELKKQNPDADPETPLSIL